MNSAIVIGRSGQVGRGLIEHLEKAGFQVLFTSSKKDALNDGVFLDLASPDSIKAAFSALERMCKGSSVRVYLAGAMTHVDLCEEKPDLCRQMNALGPIQIAEICKSKGWELTFISSEYVFGGAEYRGGKKGPFTEEDEPEPCCEYGKAKLEAERGIFAALPQSQVLRTVMVFSWDPKGMNFYMQYVRHLENFANGKKATFRIPEDQISTPAYGPAFTQAALLLARKGLSGIFNLVGPDMVSRKELVHLVAKHNGYSDIVNEAFQFVSTKELGQKAKRPLSAGLTTKKATSVGISLPSLQEAFLEIQSLK